jgi:hypothetical protein
MKSSLEIQYPSLQAALMRVLVARFLIDVREKDNVLAIPIEVFLASTSEVDARNTRWPPHTLP